mmetsp:Transcript_5568/g.9939  ORF Transcript_5568/g.9939 Transcript_5568/m.9939 type:complete len:436 (-) Transcript_5568:61-1368(-)|eukprot:CAMPEP_0197664944 /NCGR_PEP_ID=MMETSP1338-20131121/58943_1 /TAXON_ID=43686 ORGANISM="Pelagodinium beii, Strain RCC1491" /NCGR_SAMPLE_ID=MMETSP1338 /ASSEMBLY_ACC=CAM_ASM_000754 /LENGTH=435 /DNA_ID=CAMNT_0043243681 /DNA_START=76 /DNA_END=1383 /DNA_ORIENTATION=-
MVTASKVQNPQNQTYSYRSQTQTFETEDREANASIGLDSFSPRIWGDLHAPDKFGAGSASGSRPDDSEDDDEIPLCFGEQLVLETYMRYKGRRYDRKRQDELSQPRRKNKKAAEDWGVQTANMAGDAGSPGAGVVSREEVDKIVARLAKPKKPAAVESGHSVAMHAHNVDVQKARGAAADPEVFRRLTEPKKARPFDPTPGEKIVMMYQTARITRAIDPEKLAEMSRPKKRGGRAESWGLTRHHNAERQVSSTPREQSSAPQLPPAPASARAPAAAQKPSTVEKLPEVVDNRKTQVVENRTAPKQKQEITEDEEEYTDDYVEESDDQSNRKPAVRPSSNHNEERGPVATAAASWQPPGSRVPLAIPSTSNTNGPEEDSEDDEEPFFPQFGFAGQKVKPSQPQAVTTGADRESPFGRPSSRAGDVTEASTAPYGWT